MLRTVIRIFFFFFYITTDISRTVTRTYRYGKLKRISSFILSRSYKCLIFGTNGFIVLIRPLLSRLTFNVTRHIFFYERILSFCTCTSEQIAVFATYLTDLQIFTYTIINLFSQNYFV